MSDTSLLIVIIVFMCSIYTAEYFYVQLDTSAELDVDLEGKFSAREIDILEEDDFEEEVEEGWWGRRLSSLKSLVHFEEIVELGSATQNFIVTMARFLSFDIIEIAGFEYMWVISMFLVLPLWVALIYLIVRLLRGGG